MPLPLDKGSGGHNDRERNFGLQALNAESDRRCTGSPAALWDRGMRSVSRFGKPGRKWSLSLSRESPAIFGSPGNTA